MGARLALDSEHFGPADGGWRLLVQGIKDYAVFLLDAKGLVRLWNTGAERILGHGPDEILGEHVSRLYPLEDAERGLPGRHLEIAAATDRFEEEGWRINSAGARLWASALVSPLRDPDGGLLGYANVIRDLSHQTLARDRLALLAERQRIAAALSSRTIRSLFRLGLELNSVANRVDRPEVARLLAGCVGQLDDVIDELRRLAFDVQQASE